MVAWEHVSPFEAQLLCVVRVEPGRQRSALGGLLGLRRQLQDPGL